ncbi:MAG: OsmC family protein [Candidatus Sulfotelmatobacter sp.]
MRGDISMQEADQFRVVAWWSSERNGIAQSDSAPNTIHFTSPPALGGMDGRWTPQDLLLGAIASSFTTTFRALAEQSKFEHTDLQVEVQGILNQTAAGYSLSEVHILAHLTIPDEAEQARAIKMLHMTRSSCVVSRALSIQQIFEPLVTVAVPVS